MKTFSMIFSLIFLWSCNLNTSYSNRESDKREAEKVTHKLYHFLEMQEWEKAESLFSEEFFEVTDRETLNTIFRKTFENCGNLTNFTLEDWTTFIVNGTNAKSEYVLLYNVTRDKKNTTERIGMIKEADETIRILSYHVNFDMLDE